MKTLIAAALGLSLSVLAAARPAGACSCMETPPEELFANYEAVFRGSTISYEVVPDGMFSYYIYQFAVTACWKGDIGDVIQVHSNVDEAFCGVFLPIGTDFLVYAMEDSGVFFANLCSVIYAPGPTGQEHLEWLGEPNCGAVSTDVQSWGGIKSLYR